MPATISATPTVINGVALLTRSGKPKSRYSEAERLQLLGATKRDLRDFVALLCPGGPLYAVTRCDSDDPRAWTTPRGRLTDDKVLRHLTGNLTPGIKPRWIAPRCWEVTRWLGVDVDMRGDHADFLRRCGKVMQALRDLGIPEAAILESETPSGGRHFRVFFTGKIPTADIPRLFAMVGIHEAPGQIELFPKRSNGLRLPFGYIPGRDHDPQAWLRFIRAFQEGTFPKVSWLTCLKKAEAILRETFHGGPPRADAPARIAEAALGPGAVARRSRATGRVMGIPRRLRGSTVTAVGDAVRYHELLSRPVANPSEVAELWGLGICVEGTRTEATKRLAWHLLFVRRLSVAAAASQVVRWVYDTGQNTSKDVRTDRQKDTRVVEQETVRIVKSMADKHQTMPPQDQDKSRFSKAEIDRLRERLGDGVKDPTLVSVALNFLRFAKLHGTQTVDGWSVQVAVNGVMRRWPGCRGMGYKPLIAALIERGIVRMTREKRQSSAGRPGRPRTYTVFVSPDLRSGATMDHSEAALHVAQATSEAQSTPVAASCVTVRSNTYKRSIFFSPRDHTSCEQEEAQQEIEVLTGSLAGDRRVFGCANGHTRFKQAEAAVIDDLQRRLAFSTDPTPIRNLFGKVPSHRPWMRIVPTVRSRTGIERRGHRLGLQRHRWLRPPPRSSTSADEDERNES